MMFSILWLVALIFTAIVYMDGTGGSPVADVLGFAAPLASGSSEPITAMYIGGAPNAGQAP
jgi:xylose isomerase